MKLEQLPYVKMIKGKAYVRVTFRDADGKERSKHKRVRTVQEAITVTADLKRRLQHLGPEAWQGETMTFDDLLLEYGKAFPGRRRWYIDPIRDYFGRRLIRSVNYGDLRAFRTAREQIVSVHTQKPRTVATVNREMEQLKTIILWAIRNGWILKNPFHGGPSLILRSDEVRRDRILTPAEESALLAACDHPREHLRTAILATLDTGLRRGALFSLRWSNVDWEGRILIIPPANNKHKKRPKYIGITRRLYNELRAAFERTAPADDALIIGVKEVRRSFATACRNAGITGFRFNDLRHSFATNLLQAGVEQRLAMKVAGHTRIETHERYVNVDARIALDVAAKLDAWRKSTE